MFIHTKSRKSSKGFTLIEVLIVIGIIAVLAAIVIVAINPARQFAQARDSQRVSNLNTILNAVGQKMADNKGILPCGLTAPYATATIGTSVGIDLEACLTPTYISAFPQDPSIGTALNTGYEITVDATSRVHIIAETSEPAIPRTGFVIVIR